MTCVYLPHWQEGYQLCHATTVDGTMKTIDFFRSDSGPTTWQPLQVELKNDDGRGNSLKRSDAPWHAQHALFFRDAVITQLGQYLEQFGELCPVDAVSGETLFLYRPSHVIDCLDVSRSKIFHMPDGRIDSVGEYALHTSGAVFDGPFRLASPSVSPTFLSERFVEAWNENGFLGLTFSTVPVADQNG